MGLGVGFGVGLGLLAHSALYKRFACFASMELNPFRWPIVTWKKWRKFLLKKGNIILMVSQVCRSVELGVFSYANLSGLVWIRPRSCADHVIQRTFPVWYMCISKNGHAVTNLSSEDRFHIYFSKTAGNLCDIYNERIWTGSLETITCDKFYFKKQFLQLHGAFTEAECGWSAH